MVPFSRTRSSSDVNRTQAMTEKHPGLSGRSSPEGGVGLKLDPYLHVHDGSVYNPHTDRTLRNGQPGYEQLRSLLDAAPPRLDASPGLELLAGAGWLIDTEADVDNWYRLRYVSLESHTVCNQACYFCPVSVAPREPHFMPMPLYERIARELGELGEPIEGVFMISYNEPTIDPRFLEQVGCLKRAGLPIAVLTNGTGLTPATVDRLIEMGGIGYLSVNLSTLDRERYRADREGDHLRQVLTSLDHARDRPVAEKMDIAVLGTGDEVHERDFQEIRARFEGSRFEVRSFVVNDRAGYLQIGATGTPDGRLCGCDHMGSRPIQHLHIDPYGKCFLCCQDYSGNVIVGDLERSSVREVLEGPEMARARRQVYGLEEAADDFICHGCKFALKR